MARPSTSASRLPPGGSSAFVATFTNSPMVTSSSSVRLRLTRRAGVSRGLDPCDRRAGHFGLQPPEHAAEPAHPEHPQDLGEADPLDQIVADADDLLDGGAVEALDQ